MEVPQVPEGLDPSQMGEMKVPFQGNNGMLDQENILPILILSAAILMIGLGFAVGFKCHR